MGRLSDDVPTANEQKGSLRRCSAPVSGNLYSSAIEEQPSSACGTEDLVRLDDAKEAGVENPEQQAGKLTAAAITPDLLLRGGGLRSCG